MSDEDKYPTVTFGPEPLEIRVADLTDQVRRQEQALDDLIRVLGILCEREESGVIVLGVEEVRAKLLGSSGTLYTQQTPEGDLKIEVVFDE